MKFTGEITHLSQKGHGVVSGPQDDRRYFVSNTWPGDVGEFEMIDKPVNGINNKKFAYARLLRLIRPSEHRQYPACPYANLNDNPCTGCPWMIADYANQLEQKRKRFVYAMQRNGFDVSGLRSVAIQAAPETFGYRNRCQLKTDGSRLGFVSEQSGEIVAVNDCIVLNAACRQLLKTAAEKLPNLSDQPSRPIESGQSADNADRHFIDLDDAMSADDIQINRRRPFRQGNAQQNEWMQVWLKAQLEQLPDIGKVVELFCGSGNFTQIIAASNCASIFAYESDPLAVKQLRARKLPKVNAQVADLFKPSIWKTLQKHVADADTLVLDPPRAGLKKQRGFFECFRALKHIVYISCNPETFARDARSFNRQGWHLDTVQLIDLFPHTPHVEVLAVFKK